MSAAEDPVAEARRLETEGAALLDFRHSGPEAGAKVVAAVSIPVLGGLGGGPWLDGRMRTVHRLLEAPLAEYVEDVHAERPVRGD
jgi:3-methyl-2-oxobutanoate hydroxymethyltransferase